MSPTVPPPLPACILTVLVLCRKRGGQSSADPAGGDIGSKLCRPRSRRHLRKPARYAVPSGSRSVCYRTSGHRYVGRSATTDPPGPRGSVPTDQRPRLRPARPFRQSLRPPRAGQSEPYNGTAGANCLKYSGDGMALFTQETEGHEVQENSGRGRLRPRWWLALLVICVLAGGAYLFIVKPGSAKSRPPEAGGSKTRRGAGPLSYAPKRRDRGKREQRWCSGVGAPEAAWVPSL